MQMDATPRPSQTCRLQRDVWVFFNRCVRRLAGCMLGGQQVLVAGVCRHGWKPCRALCCCRPVTWKTNPTMLLHAVGSRLQHALVPKHYSALRTCLRGAQAVDQPGAGFTQFAAFGTPAFTGLHPANSRGSVIVRNRGCWMCCWLLAHVRAAALPAHLPAEDVGEGPGVGWADLGVDHCLRQGHSRQEREPQQCRG